MAVVQDILTYIYCMPLYRLAVILTALCGIFLELRGKYGAQLWWKLLMLAGAAVSIVAIGLETFWGRIPGGAQLAPILTPFHTYRAYLEEPFEEILRMNFMNTVLFFPGGLFLCEALPAKWNRWIKMLLILVFLSALSVGIEYIQYAYALGQAEIDDVIHNVLGAFLGTLVITATKPTFANNKTSD